MKSKKVHATINTQENKIFSLVLLLQCVFTLVWNPEELAIKFYKKLTDISSRRGTHRSRYSLKEPARESKKNPK